MLITWDKPGSAQVIRFEEGDLLTVISTLASPPGSPLSGKLGPAPEIALRMKIRNCKAQPDGQYTLIGRLVSPTRELREKLTNHFANAANNSGEQGLVSPQEQR